MEKEANTNDSVFDCVWRPLLGILSGRLADTLPLGMGGWVRGQKTVCAPKVSLKFPEPLIDFIFLLRKIVLILVGGVGWPGSAKDPNAPPRITKQ